MFFWNECSRPISNAVIYYNTLLRSRVYAQKQAAGDREALAIVKDISPVAWQHINLFGTRVARLLGTLHLPVVVRISPI
jgi:hypothetical protein